MPAINAITADKLARLVGTAACPAIVLLGSEPGLIPGAIRREAERLADWGSNFPHLSAIVVCGDGRGASPGVAAWLRQAGIRAEILEGGLAAWREAWRVSPNSESRNTADVERSSIAHSSSARAVIGLANR